MTTYIPPRGADGKILVGPLPLIDDSALRDEPPPAAPAQAPAQAAAEASAPPPRRRSDTPTPIGQLRPGQVGGSTATPAGGDWRIWLAWVAALAILAAAAWALWPRAEASTATPAAPSPAAVTAPAVTATAAAELARAIVVFDAPEGTPIGALEPGRRYSLLDEQGGWRLLDVPGSGAVWARAWEMDGTPPPTPTPLHQPVPTQLPPAPRPQPAPVFVPAGPPTTCLPVVDADNGDRYLGDTCGTTSEERQATALALLQAAPPPTLSGQP